MLDVLIDKKISENIFFVINNGVTYLHIDLTNTEDDYDVLEIIRDLIMLLEKQKDNSIIVVTDVTDMDVSFNTQQTIRVMLKRYQHVFRKSAFTGVGPYLIPFYKLYKLSTGSKAELFTTYEEAVSYLLID